MRSTLPLLIALFPLLSFAGQAVILNQDNWHLVPAGKEVDAIYGDIVIRNDKVVAVIGGALPNRQLNLRINRAQGCLLDFTTLAANNDQLTVYHPHAFSSKPFVPPPVNPATQATTGPTTGPATKPAVEEPLIPAADEVEIVQGQGAKIIVRAVRQATEQDPVGVMTEYTLEDGDCFVRVVTRRTNSGPKPRIVRLTDRFWHDKPALVPGAGRHALVYTYDRYFGMAYGLVRTDRGVLSIPAATPVLKSTAGLVDYPDLLTEGAGPGSMVLEPGKTVVQERMLLVGTDAAAVQQAANEALRSGPVTGVIATVHDFEDQPMEGIAVSAYVAKAWDDARTAGARRGLTARSFARTNNEGRVMLPLPPGAYVLVAEDPGRVAEEVRQTVGVDHFLPDRPEISIVMGEASTVAFEVVDEKNQPSPAKVQFMGMGNTPTPDLGPDQRAEGCRNLWFSVKGTFEVPLPPGDYAIAISRGPEYNAVWRTIKLAPGGTALVKVRLPRVVETRGWISADFHNHSTLSGDNATQVEGRLATLICEGVEFAPATEHQRITSYRPYLKAMGAEHLMGTSDGMELTGSPLLIAHHNAFPLKEVPRTQFAGGPEVDKDPRVQLRRLRVFDNNSEKLVQQNHPDIGWLVYDKDGDQQADSGYMTLEYTDVIEVWAPTILEMKATRIVRGNEINDRVFNWLQLLNQGYRLPGVANTDAHHCFHDSGYIRNYVKCSTDDPAKIGELEIVRASRKGQSVMSSGPFMEVLLNGAGPGDDLKLSGEGKLSIRVQCPNWFDVDRVQVLINGAPEAALNFTRSSHPAMFGDGVVKFEQALALKLAADAHVIVVAAGENSATGPMMGEGDMPLAVSNPIYVDVNGDGFKPNLDTLGAPLPVKRAKD